MKEFTKPTRYEKHGILYINEKKYSLIEFLQENQIENRITKKFISNVIKKMTTGILKLKWERKMIPEENILTDLI